MIGAVRERIAVDDEKRLGDMGELLAGTRQPAADPVGEVTLWRRAAQRLGIAVETRFMAWNFPSGNEDIIYFLYTFYNVTARDPAVYAAAVATASVSSASPSPARWRVPMLRPSWVLRESGRKPPACAPGSG